MVLAKKIGIAALGGYVGINFVQNLIPGQIMNIVPVANLDLYLAIGIGVVIVDHFI